MKHHLSITLAAALAFTSTLQAQTTQPTTPKSPLPEVRMNGKKIELKELNSAAALAQALKLGDNAVVIESGKLPDSMLKKLVVPNHLKVFFGTHSDEGIRNAASLQHLPLKTGLTVLALAADSPAEKAGIKLGDILYKFDDQKLVNNQQFRALLRSSKVGQKVSITLLRDLQPVTLDVTLAERAPSQNSASLSEENLKQFTPEMRKFILDSMKKSLPANPTHQAKPGNAPNKNLLDNIKHQSHTGVSMFVANNKIYRLSIDQHGKKILTVSDMKKNTLYQGELEKAAPEHQKILRSFNIDIKPIK